MTDIPKDGPDMGIRENDSEFVEKAKYGNSPATSAQAFNTSPREMSYREVLKNLEENLTVQDNGPTIVSVKGSEYACQTTSDAALTLK